MCDRTAYDPSPLLRQVFAEHAAHYGDPDMVYHYGPTRIAEPETVDRVDVYVWRPTEAVPMTTFSTLGMSDRPMTGCDHRAEIHFTVRGNHSDDDESMAAAFLANLAARPFLKGTHFDHWHLLPSFHALPLFPSCTAGVFHPSFIEGGWDTIRFGDQIIKILNFVPLTAAEFQRARTAGIAALLNALYESRVDIFSDRSEIPAQRTA